LPVVAGWSAPYGDLAGAWFGFMKGGRIVRLVVVVAVVK